MDGRVLITGGSGFIGTNLVEYYSSKGWHILNLDIVKPKRNDHKCFWTSCDINNYSSLENEILKFNPKLVLHLAARTDLDGKSLSDYKTNTTGTLNLIKCLRKLNDIDRVIFFSSMLVCEIGYQPSFEDDYKPTTTYGLSKVEMEKIIRENSHNYTWIIVRPTSIWGPYFDIPYKNFFDMIIQNKYFHIGSKTAKKTYGFVGNTIYQIDALLNSTEEKINRKIFYLGDYNPIDIREWANEIALELNNKKIIIIPYPLIKFLALVGDFINFFNISFPLTSFRLKNMTTDNIINMEHMVKIVYKLPYTRRDGIKATLKWILDKEVN